MRVFCSRLTLLVVTCLLFGTVNLVAEDTESKVIKTLTPPKAIENKIPEYPRRRLRDSEEGWVRLQAMVDTQGKPYEIVVEDSVGHPAFEHSAISALERTEFKPGEYDGNLVDGVVSRTYIFEIQRDNPMFFSRYRNIYRETIRAIESDDQAAATKRLRKLRDNTKTLNEDGLRWFVQFKYDLKWGTKEEQLKSVKRAVGFEDAPSFLEDKLYVSMILAELNLQIELNHLADALDTIQEISELDMEGITPEILAELDRRKKLIESVRDEGTQFVVSGRLDKNGYWSYELLRNRFALTDVDGVVNEHQLYCQKDKVRFIHEPLLEYSVSKTQGECWLRVIGKPDTTFVLAEL